MGGRHDSLGSHNWEEARRSRTGQPVPLPAAQLTHRPAVGSSSAARPLPWKEGLIWPLILQLHPHSFGPGACPEMVCSDCPPSFWKQPCCPAKQIHSDWGAVGWGWTRKGLAIFQLRTVWVFQLVCTYYYNKNGSKIKCFLSTGRQLKDSITQKHGQLIIPIFNGSKIPMTESWPS